MTQLTWGLIAGLIFGTMAVVAMLRLSFPDKKAALQGAFVNRFSIGVVIGCIQTPMPGWLSGLLVGVLLSAPPAIISKAYIPIIGFGAVGGAIIGGLINGWS